MNFQILVSNLTNPTLLFFILGALAVIVKSDLSVPESSSKFIALYLLFSIGFKGGQELSHSSFSLEIILTLLFGLLVAGFIPVYSFYILKRFVSVSNAAAVAAAYGSVSAVTFVTAVSFLEMQNIHYGGHMVAVMALMEFPAIVLGVLLAMRYDEDNRQKGKLVQTIRHAMTNGSVLMIVGSLIIGLIADSKQAEGIKPFTTDIFKGFLAIFLLEMGMVTARRFGSFRKYGLFALVFATLVPLANGSLVALLSSLFIHDVGNRFMFAVLAASASYIAVPAAMRLAVPKSEPGLYIPMALGITFPFNITIGMPIYYQIVNSV